MSRVARSFLAAFAGAAALGILAACGGGGGGSATPAVGTRTSPIVTATAAGSAAATFAVSLQQYAPVVTSATKRRSPAFLSPATASLSLSLVSVNGATTAAATSTFAVGPTAPNCASVNGTVNCTFSMNIPAGADVLSASTLDANGHVLGTSQIAATVTLNATNRIPLAIGGQIANLQMYVSSNRFTPGASATSSVIVVPLDASGAEIVNPGNYTPAIAVTSSSPAGGHLSLITDGTNTGQTATIASPDDQVVVAYDGIGTTGGSTITATAGTGISASRDVSISAAGFNASTTGAQFVSSSTYIFTAAGQTGTIVPSGGTPPYTVVSGDTSLVSVSGPATGTSSYTLTAAGFGVNGSTSITVSDSAGAHTTIPVTFFSAPVTLTVAHCGTGATCTATSATYPVPANGSPALNATTIAAGGGIGTFAYAFTSSGTTASPYATVAQSGSSFTITPNGSGNDGVLIASGNQTTLFSIVAAASGAGYNITQVSAGYAPSGTALDLAYGSAGSAGTATIALTASNAPWTVTNTCGSNVAITNSNNTLIVTAAAASGTCTIAPVPAIGTAPAALQVTLMPTLSTASSGIAMHAVGETATDAIANGAPGGLTVGTGSIAVVPATGVVALGYSNGTLTVTATGTGTANITVHDTVTDEKVAIAVTVDSAFASSLPAATGLKAGSPYALTVPSTVASVALHAGVAPAGFGFTAGNPGTLSAAPVAGTGANGQFRFHESNGGYADVPFTTFAFVYGSYAGSNINATANEAFSGSGQIDTVTCNGAVGIVTGVSSNANVVTVTASSNVLTVTAHNAGTATMTVTDSTGAATTYSVSVTTTTIPVASIDRSR